MSKTQQFRHGFSTSSRRGFGVLVLASSLAGVCGVVSAQAPVAPAASGASAALAAPAAAPVRLRGTVEKIIGNALTVKERSGEMVTLTLAEKLNFQEVVAIDIAAIAPGAYIGTAATERADGQLQALEVLVFPEAARGTGEGHYPWDLEPKSTMTNATVTDLVKSANGRELTVKYKDSTKKLIVPDGVPVVTFKPGDRALLKPGAKVFVVAVMRDGVPTAATVLIGRDGFTPPM